MSIFLPDQAGAIRSGEEIDLQALQRYIDGEPSTLGRIMDVKQFPSGFSNLTYAITTDTGEYVLRKPPAGVLGKSAHDMGREYKVLQKLYPIFSRIPKPILLCEDLSVLGAPFYVMTRLTGVILRAHHANQNLSPAMLQRLSEALVDQLVLIHQLDIHETGLISLGKPEGYVHRQVEGWTQRYAQSETEKIEAMTEVSGWIKQNQPVSSQISFLHNDFKYDNVVVDRNEPTRIVGILDWEMATVGDPLMDVGATLAYWCESTDDPLARMFNLSWLPGNLSRQQFIERYAAQTGCNITSLPFYYVFGLFKNAVVAQQIYARWKKGYSQDSRFGQLIEVVKSLAARAQKAIETQRI
jgi:aminoglycoside phosphotransferase (APT) family kinase protein